MKFTATLAGVAFMLAATTAQATIIIPAAGQDLTRGTTESNAVQVYSEQVGVTVDGSMTVDFLVGTNLNVGDTKAGVSNFSSGQTLTAGIYDSFFVHFDPLSANSVSNIVVDFGQTIVGLLLSNSNGSNLLNVSDGTFGTAAAYDNHLGRRTENSDSFSLTSATSLTLNLSTNAAHVDNIRVLTAPTAVPTPATLPLLFAGLFALGVAGRRKRKSA